MIFRNRAIINLLTVDSTNNYAANLIKLSHPPEGTVITAQHQSSGKGQRNANWESQEGENLICSIILYPKFIAASNQFALSQAISLALHQVIYHHCNSDVFVKWPNDIIIDNKKIAGILIESTWSQNKMSSSVIGIGINLNQLLFESPNATSIKNITGKYIPGDAFLTELVEGVQKFYIKLQSGNYPEIDRSYLDKLFRIGIASDFIFEEKEIIATIVGVDQYGRLKLQKKSGEYFVCNFKEIRMVF